MFLYSPAGTEPPWASLHKPHSNICPQGKVTSPRQVPDSLCGHLWGPCGPTRACLWVISTPGACFVALFHTVHKPIPPPLQLFPPILPLVPAPPFAPAQLFNTHLCGEDGLSTRRVCYSLICFCVPVHRILSYGARHWGYQQWGEREPRCLAGSRLERHLVSHNCCES